LFIDWIESLSWWNEGTMAEIEIKMIDWTEDNIGVEGARMVSEALKCNSSLVELNLKGDEIELIEIEWIEMKQMSE